MNFGTLRPGQQAALDTILSRIKAKESKTAIVLPTRYGKSDVIRLAAIHSKDEMSCSGSIALSPSDLLRNQLVRGDKLDQMAQRYGLSASTKQMRVMLSASEVRPFSNGEYLLSATIQLATSNIWMLCDLVNSQSHKTGLPVLVHIDECHQTSEEKKRGELVRELEQAGALIVLYTATAIRADGELIPGFKVREVSREDVKRYIVTDAGDGKHNRVDVYDGERSVVELVADHATSFQQAWNEKPSPICNLSREVIQVNLNDLSAGEESISLSECSPSKAQKYLSKAVRNPVVIEKAVELFTNELKLRQRINPDAAGIIFTCNDVTGQHNKHAREISDAIAAITPEFQSCIVTMKSAIGDEASTKQVERFVGVDGRGGKGDVLLVKQIGGAGLDSPRIKVLLDLSPVRTVASVIQRLMRVATPWDGMKIGSVITLADPLMNAIWKKYVVEEGGEAATSNIDGVLDLVDSYLTEKSDDPDKPLMEILSAGVHGFDDNNGQSGNVESLAFINALLSRIPTLAELHTKAELSELLAGFDATPSPQPQPQLGASIDKKRVAINRRVKELAQEECPYNPASPGPHVELMKYWMKKAKSGVGIPLDIELKDIVNTSTLDAMLNLLAR